MYLSTDIHTEQTFKADKASVPGFIRLCVGSNFYAKLSAAEAQQLIAELQRELAVVEAVARGVTA